MKKIIYFYYFRSNGGNNQTGPNWLTYTLLIYINLHVKQGSNLIITFWVDIQNMKKTIFVCIFWGSCGPLHKIHGQRGHHNVSKCRFHHSGDIMYIKENNWKPVFHVWAKMYVFSKLKGPGRVGGGGGIQWLDWAHLALQLSSHPYVCICEIRKQSEKKF